MKMRWIVRLLTGCVIAVAVPLVAHATWVDDNCLGSGSELNTWKRSQAKSYAEPTANEGYEWNGGCYKLNDRDDTPLLEVDASGEGADCSGLVFRVWGLRADGGQLFKYWGYDKDIHGPYYSWDFVAPETDEPFKVIGKTYRATTYMDALGWFRGDDRHIALIYVEGEDGSDYVIHARNNDVGTAIEWQPYRSYSDSKAVFRKNWTLECYPKCPPK
jgi:hypothetical protein